MDFLRDFLTAAPLFPPSDPPPGPFQGLARKSGFLAVFNIATANAGTTITLGANLNDTISFQ